MSPSDSSPDNDLPLDTQAESPDPGPPLIPASSGGACRKDEGNRNGHKRQARRERNSRVPESLRTDRRGIPPGSRSLLAIAKEGRMSLFGAHELLSIWAAATGTSLRSGDDRLKTVRCEDIYVATGRNGSDRMVMHWNVQAGLVSAVEKPTAWATMAMTTLANMVFPERHQDEKDHMEESERMNCYGRSRPSRAEISDLIDTRNDSPYYTTLRSLSDKADAARLATGESIDVLYEARKRHGLDHAPFSCDRNESGLIIANEHGQFDPRRIKLFLGDRSAVEAAARYLTSADSEARAQRRLESYRASKAPWKITGLGPDEYERWPTPDEWGTYACREVAKALYRMSSIRRIELDRLASEFADDLDGMTAWRFSATIDDTIRDIQQVLLKTGVEIT